jgi:hypothetical protein
MNKYSREFRNTLTSNPAKSPFCSTCKKAGLTYAEYTSHWTKSSPGPEGIIICPLILNTVCKYCKETGHWIKYCPVIKRKETTYYSKKTDLVLEDYRSSNESLVSLDTEYMTEEPRFRPSSPDYPPPDYTEPVMSKEKKTWAQII